MVMLLMTCFVLFLIAPIIILFDKKLGWAFQVAGLWIISYVTYNTPFSAIASKLVLLTIVWTVCSIFRLYGWWRLKP